MNAQVLVRIGTLVLAVGTLASGAARGADRPATESGKATVHAFGSPGGAPPGFECGSSGEGRPVWSVDADKAAPSPPGVLKQSGEVPFAWCAIEGSEADAGWIEARLKTLGGKFDQAAGIIWRFKDKDNYLIARINSLEDNVALFVMLGGRRRSIQSVDVPVPSKTWHRLRVEYEGARISVSFNGRKVLDVVESRLLGPGRVGVWTKADSVSAFDDVSFKDRPKAPLKR